MKNTLNPQVTSPVPVSTAPPAVPPVSYARPYPEVATPVGTSVDASHATRAAFQSRLVGSTASAPLALARPVSDVAAPTSRLRNSELHQHAQTNMPREDIHPAVNPPPHQPPPTYPEPNHANYTELGSIAPSHGHMQHVRFILLSKHTDLSSFTCKLCFCSDASSQSRSSDAKYSPRTCSRSGRTQRFPFLDTVGEPYLLCCCNVIKKNTSRNKMSGSTFIL